jgi:Na+/proline symporter
VAVEGLSVLRLFLIADLLAAAVALPVFLGLWGRVTTAGAFAGAAAGILAVVGVGWIEGGTLLDGLRWLTLPPEASPLGPFLAAPLASGVVTVLASLARAEAR